jgi:hypothetical protein
MADSHGQAVRNTCPPYKAGRLLRLRQGGFDIMQAMDAMDARFLFFLGLISALAFLSLILILGFSTSPTTPKRDRLPVVNAVIVDRGKP